jgi:hypothetical protein
MATPELDLALQRAGRDYLGALTRLGLEPDALFWAWDESVGGFVLVLATDFFDFKGPLEVSRLLFKAYNLAATPREIDPFIIRLHSSDQPIVDWLTRLVSGVAVVLDEHNKELKRSNLTGGTSGGLRVSRDWVYRLPTRTHPRKPADLSRRWERLQRNVDRLAA